MEKSILFVTRRSCLSRLIVEVLRHHLNCSVLPYGDDEAPDGQNVGAACIIINTDGMGVEDLSVIIQKWKMVEVPIVLIVDNEFVTDAAGLLASLQKVAFFDVDAVPPGASGDERLLANIFQSSFDRLIVLLREHLGT